MQQVVLLKDADRSGPLQRSQRGFYRASQRVIKGQEPRGFTGPKHEMGKTFGPIGEGAHDEGLRSGHGVNIAGTGERGNDVLPPFPLRNQLRLGFDLDDPEAGVDVGNVDQTVPVDGPPRVRGVGNGSVSVAGDHVCDLSTLALQISPELAGDVEHPRPPW